MSLDCYRIEVLHFLNPHLLWVEVIDLSNAKKDNFIFEQIGIYGLLPLEPVLDIVEQNLQTRILDKWLPAASATINNALSEAHEVWFSPTFIDRRSSIFDDNIHKYGEILLKKTNGKLYPLSKTIIKSGFAVYDICLFHQELENGSLTTKLQNFEAQDVIKNIENYYRKKKVPKIKWENSVKTKTVVAQTSQEFETALTEMNLEKHNNKLMAKLLENKMKDFEMCKGIDEESVGRVYKAKKKRENIDIASTELSTSDCTEPDLKSAILKRKLQLIGTKKLNTHSLDTKNKNDIKVMITETTEFLKKNAYNENNGKYDDGEQQNSNTSKIESSLLTESYKELPSNLMFINSKEKRSNFIKNDDKTETGSKEVIKKQYLFKPIEKRISYGPPGISPVLLPYKIMTQSEFKHEQMEIYKANKEDSTVNEDISTKSDIDITSKDYLINIGQDENIIRNTLSDRLEKELKENSEQCDLSHPYCDDSSSDVALKSSNSKVLKRKLMLHQEKIAKTLNGSFTSSSDTTNKDSSSSIEEIMIKKRETRSEVTNGSDDEDIEEIIKKINKEYPISNIPKEAKMPECPNYLENYKSSMKISVNPFKNIDSNLSSFTDKVVTPVLMVHTKMNKRIEPVFKISDVHFNTHIRIVLKNMSIVRPMMLQTISWFCILRGYSMFMVSPLGSGKTVGYLPAVCRLVSDSYPDDNVSVGPKCIVVCATAKSVTDVERMAKMFLGVKEKVLSCFAGVDETQVITSLLNGCDLLICTPSFLVRLLRATDFGVDMRRLATLVMDDCERLSEVYSDEVKYIFLKIKDSIKNRTNKELKVQYILASRVWCNFMEGIAKKAPYPVVCIGAFQECVLYSKANMTMNFVQQDNKVKSVHNFLDDVDLTKKIIIVCRTDEEVVTLQKALGKYNNPLFACDSSLTIQDLYNLRTSWDEYKDPLLGPILLCSDDTLTYLNVTDAHYLLNYSLPHLFSAFCKRFSVLNDNYPSIFKTSSGNVKIKILVEEANTEQLPKMINFIKRCTDNIPKYLNKICDGILTEKDMLKASKLVPVCDNLLGLGYCADFFNCISRHTVFKDYDESKEWIPKTGQITFKILHYHSAVHYSVRLLSKTVNGEEHKYPQTYNKLSLKMGLFYSKESNKKPHGIPKVGDICAVSMKQSFFVRCQVIKILSNYPRGNPNSVLVKLIDEEILENTRDVYLYHLPEELKNIETHVIQVRLANVQPKDKDVTFSNLSRDKLKEITDRDEESFVRGQAIMAIGNCVFVDTLEACQELSSLNKTVVKHDFKRDLLQKHATVNMEHMVNVKKFCDGKIRIVDENTENDLLKDSKEPSKTLPRGTWAYLDKDIMSLVFLGSVINPHNFFVRLEKFEPCLNLLIKDIQKYVAENPERLEEVNKNDIVLAMFPDDEMFERARIDTVIEGNTVRCFFLDQGDWRDVTYQNLAPIKEEFITKIPFQAIECRLVGVKPAGEEWTDFTTNWFCDKCFNDSNDSLKHLYVKYCYKEKAECTDGNKYGIVLIDTNGDSDVVINQLLIDVNLAQENIDEMKYLNEFRINNDANKKSNSAEDSLKGDDDKNEHFTKCAKREVNDPCSTSTLQTLFKKPIRSVPLVDSDCEDSDGSERWHINMTDDFLKMFKPVTNAQPSPSNLPRITMGEATTDTKAKTEGIRSIVFPKVSLQPKSELSELDSDDYTSPEYSDSVNESEKVIKTSSAIDQTRKPRLVWRQNRNFVVIKINLIGLQKYELTIQGRSLAFAATNNSVNYAFDFELYGAINVDHSSHSNKGQYILVKLSKILNKNWLTLTKDGAIRKWIVYDLESIEASSDEETIEEQDRNEILNVIKNIHNRDETESEDDDFMDDINYGHKRDEVLFHDIHRRPAHRRAGVVNSHKL